MSANGKVIDCREQVKALCEVLGLDYPLCRKIVVTPAEVQAICYLPSLTGTGLLMDHATQEPMTQLMTLKVRA